VKYVDEYRDGVVARRLFDDIGRIAKHPWVVMEVCGGQTHSIVRYGLDRLLPDNVELVHGPGCPVCVTPLETIDRAHAIARRPGVVFTSFGDMLRVPGSTTDLLRIKAAGGDVRVVTSPLHAVEIAAKEPHREVVFFAIGFETTAPANAMAVKEAHRRQLGNFSVLTSHVLVPPSIASILQATDNRVQGFLGPGHVCAITGLRAYRSLAQQYGTPIVVTGFEPIDLLEGLKSLVEELEAGRHGVKNAYARIVPEDGNRPARAVMDEVFEVVDHPWRGIGRIPKSGLRIRSAFRALDAAVRFDVTGIHTVEPSECVSGRVLRGLLKPCDCPAFGKRCTPETPLGATMVSSEGACAAYYRYGRAHAAVAK
jgi:hydrogenase expression/formation protein HypD